MGGRWLLCKRMSGGVAEWSHQSRGRQEPSQAHTHTHTHTPKPINPAEPKRQESARPPKPVDPCYIPLLPSLQVDADAADPDSAPPVAEDDAAAAAAGAPLGDGQPSTSYTQQQEGIVRRGKSALRQYVESFDQETLVQTAK